MTQFFAPEAWGTISDWCLILVTITTAYFLYKTLQSQKEVQKTQTKLFEIESIRFRESIKPKLHYSVVKDIFKPGDDNKRILTIEVTNETDSIALEITSDYKDSVNANQVLIPVDFTSAQKDHLVKGDRPLFLHFLIESTSKLKGIFIFTITYKDVAGIKYKQRVFCDDYSQGTEIYPYLPEIIN